MLIWSQLVRLIDWFIPAEAKLERSERGLAQNFVFTHLFGPLLSQSISLFLYLSDPHPGFACWTVIVCIWLFWAFPFVYKKTGDLQLSALISVRNLRSRVRKKRNRRRPLLRELPMRLGRCRTGTRRCTSAECR